MTQDDDMLAAEYVLGTLDLETRARAEARLRDPAFAAAVLEWEIRHSGLNVEYAEAPAPDLMPAIEARLFPTAPKRRLWQMWGASALASLALLAYLAVTPIPPDFTARMVAETGLEYDAKVTDERLVVVLAGGTGAPQGQAHELWLIVGEAAPVSLGLLGTRTEIRLADVPEGAILAVSLEPEGGSPTGAPTGPVLALAPLQKA